MVTPMKFIIKGSIPVGSPPFSMSANTTRAAKEKITMIGV